MIIRYVVRAEDTILSLAKRFKIAPCSILMANGISENQLMKEGKTILLPVNTMSFLEGYKIKYVVKPADTLHGIAQKYGTTAEKIKQNNNIGAIFIGQELTLSVD